MHNYKEDLHRLYDLGLDWQSCCVLQLLGRHYFEDTDQFNTVAEFLIDIVSAVEDSPEDVVSIFFDGLHDKEFTLDDLDTEDGYMKVESYIYESLEDK